VVQLSRSPEAHHRRAGRSVKLHPDALGPARRSTGDDEDVRVDLEQRSAATSTPQHGIRDARLSELPSVEHSGLSSGDVERQRDDHAM
jgi:hypothetical protein